MKNKNYKNQKACQNCKFSRISAASKSGLYCNIEDNYPKPSEKGYSMDFFELSRVYEIKNSVDYTSICDEYESQ